VLLRKVGLRLDLDSQKQTPWHGLIPKTRLVCVVLLVFAIALTPNGRWGTWGIYGLGVGAIVLLSQITLTELLRRMTVEFLFVSLTLVGTLFHPGGTVLWQWGGLQVTTAGTVILGSVVLKVLLSLAMLNLLTLTTPIPDLLHALADLRMPPLLIAILASMYRYLVVLVDEFEAMRRAALSRNLLSRKQWQRLVVGQMIGSLFIRSYDRGERVYQAMIARGYTGLPPIAEVPVARSQDLIALSLTILLALLGQISIVIG